MCGHVFDDVGSAISDTAKGIGSLVDDAGSFDKHMLSTDGAMLSDPKTDAEIAGIGLTAGLAAPEILGAGLAGDAGADVALGGAGADILGDSGGALSALSPTMFSDAATAAGTAPDLSLSSLTDALPAASGAASSTPDAGYIASALGTDNKTLSNVLKGGAGVLGLISALQKPQTATQKQVLANENNYNSNANAYSKQMIDAMNNASLKRTPIAPTGNPATYGANPEQNLFATNTGQLYYPQVPTTTGTYAEGGHVDKLSMLLDEFNNKHTPHFAGGGGLPINQPKMPTIAPRHQNFKPPFIRNHTPMVNSPLGHINGPAMAQFPSPTAGRHFAVGGSTTQDPTDILAELGIISDGKGGYRSSQMGGSPPGASSLREALVNSATPDLGPYAKMFIPHYNIGPRPITPAPVEKFAHGGSAMPQGSGALGALPGPSHKGGAIGQFVSGPGAGQDDNVNAKLSDGEYVNSADIVSALGDGNNRAGAAKLDALGKIVRNHKTQNGNRLPPKAKKFSDYMKEAGL